MIRFTGFNSIYLEVLPSAMKLLRDEYEKQMALLNTRASQQNRRLTSWPRTPEVVVQSIVDNLVIGDGGCWNWNARSKDWDGYPIILCGKKKWRGARLIMFLTRESFGSKPMTLHICDNPSCLNPSHLLEGTGKDNRQDCVKKGRANSNAHRKLTAEQVGAIRKEYQWRTPGRTIYDLAHRFGISPTGIWAIISNTTWKSTNQPNLTHERKET